MEDFTDLQGQNINDFIANYRASLEEQRDAERKLAEQTRENAGASTMGTANVKGMLYSNFPARGKIRYDTDIYYPQLTKINTAYQTGLDALRNNAIKYYNQIREYEQSMADLKDYYDV